MHVNGKKKEGSVLFNDTLNTFIHGYMILDIRLWTAEMVRGRKEGNVLFNDTLNTFYFTVRE